MVAYADGNMGSERREGRLSVQVFVGRNGDGG